MARHAESHRWDHTANLEWAILSTGWRVFEGVTIEKLHQHSDDYQKRHAPPAATPSRARTNNGDLLRGTLRAAGVKFVQIKTVRKPE